MSIDADTHNALEAAIEVGARARSEYGRFAQDTMIIEECGELIAAIAQHERGRITQGHVEEEIADVLLTCLGALTPAVLRHLVAKTVRLRVRLEEG